MEVIIDGVKYVPNVSRETNKPTLADWFEKYDGTKEYDGIVETIQKWYYGKLVKASWCATSLSYALSRLGIMKYTIGSKQENVKLLYDALKNTGTASVVDITGTLKRGDIVIFKWESGGLFTTTCKKHVAVVQKDSFSHEGTVTVIGGNQDNKICSKVYTKASIYAVFRPDYNKVTVDSI